MEVRLTDLLSLDGTIAVGVESDRVRVSGSHIGIDVETAAEVTIRGSDPFFFRLKLRWNGGVADPTIEAVWPPDYFEAGVSIFVELQGNVDPHEWVIRFAWTNSIVRDELSIRTTPGNLLQQITYSGFVDAFPNWEYIGFITKNASGTAIYPDNGDVCWIEVPAAP